MKTLCILTCSFIFLTLNMFGQLQIDWQQCYGGSEWEVAEDILKTDNGFIVIGSTPSTDGQVSNNYGYEDYWIVKTDSMGNVIWDKNYGGSYYDVLFDGFYAANSTDFYLMGNSSSVDGDISYDPYNGKNNIWVVRLDIDGNIVWDRKVGSPVGLAYDQLGTPASDGGVILSAQVDRLGGDVSVYYGGYDGWVIKLDSTGKTDWDFTAGTSEFEFINYVRQTSDGGYLACMSGMPNGVDGNIDCKCMAGSPDGILYKLDAGGNGVWNKCYGGSNIDGIIDVVETDSGYLFIGFTNSSDGDLENSGFHGKHDVWVGKTDLSGNLIWSRCYGGSEDDSPAVAFETSEGDFVVFANTHSFNGDVTDNPSNSPSHSSIWVFKINGSGDLLWQQCIGSHADEDVYGVTQLGDQDYFVAGKMTYSPSGDVNCSNFVYGSRANYWAFGLTDITVDRNEHPEITGVTVFPNPARSVINIRLPENLTGKNTKIEFYDTFGKQILTKKPETAFTRIDISGLHPGLYLIVIRNDNVFQTRKIIVQ